MRELTATMTSNGRLTIPADVRRRLGLGSGATVVFVLTDEGTVELRVPRYPTIASLRGAAGTLPQPMSWDEIKRVVADERAAAYRARHGDRPAT
ncbi:MAG TPA: AbrB/MazE/SpoVT family DNA-binding domain-containing protein [Thermomicrobiales bacterium]|nr:AbrB/MazE/SpoVT family DNA-binding domain-containing protein [Thermomicrobiales bacterium]